MRSESANARGRSLALALALGVALCLSGCNAGGREAALGTGADGDVTGSAHPWPPITREQLVGLDASEVERILGPTDFRRDDGPVEFWQYRSADCALDLYLYPDPAAVWRVEHVASRDLGTPPLTDGACVRDLLRQRQRAAGPAGGAGALGS